MSKKNVNLFFHFDVLEWHDATSLLVRHLCQELSRYFDVSLFIYSDCKTAKEVSFEGFKIHLVPRPRIYPFYRVMKSPTLRRVYNSLVAFSPKLYLHARKFGEFDYSVGIDSYAGFTVALLSKLSGKKFIFRPNDCLLDYGTQYFRSFSKVFGAMISVYGLFIEFLLTRLSALMIYPSSKTQISFTKYYRAPTKSCVFPPIGFDDATTDLEEPEREIIRKELHIPNSVFLVLFLGVGDFLPNQLAIEYILKTLSPALESTNPDVWFTIVGKQTEGYRTMIRSNNVSIAGKVPDIRPYLTAADLGIVPLKVVGGTSSKTIEYLCSGLPVLGTKGALETVEPQMGLFESDLDTFPSSIVNLKSANLGEMRKAIKEEAAKHYSFKKIGDKLADEILFLN